MKDGRGIARLGPLFLLVYGGLALYGLGQLFWAESREDPPVVFRYNAIEILWPGATAEEVGELVALPIQRALSSVEELDWARAECRHGYALIFLKTHESDTRPERVWNEINRILATLERDLPPQVNLPILRSDVGQIYPFLVTLTPEDASPESLHRLAQVIGEELSHQSWVGDYRLIGGPEKQIVFQTSPEDLQDFDLNPFELPELLAAQLSSGMGLSDDELNLIQVGSTPTNLEDLKNWPVSPPNEEFVYYLGDLFDIEERYQTTNPVFAHGQPALSVAISLTEGTSLANGHHQIRRWMSGLESTSDVRAEFTANEHSRLEDRLGKFRLQMLIAALIVMAILIAYFRFPLGVILSAVLPIVFLGTFGILAAIGISINLMTMAAFVILFGLAVDNHIVIAHRCRKNLLAGQTIDEACRTTVHDLHRPLLAAAATTIAGFLPILLAQSSASEYIRPLFWVVGIGLTLSEIIGLTLTPWLVSLFHKNQEATSTRTRAINQARPAFTLLMTGAFLLALGTFLFSQLEQSFFPPSDRAILEIEVHADSTMIESETLRIREGLVSVFAEEEVQLADTTFIGRTAPRYVLNMVQYEYQPDLSRIVLDLGEVSPSQKYHLARAIEGWLDWQNEQNPLTRVRLIQLEGGPAIGYPIKVRFLEQPGDSLGPMLYGGSVRREFSEALDTHFTDSNWSRYGSTDFEPDLELLAENGLSRREVLGSIALAGNGLPMGGVVLGDFESVPIFLTTETQEEPTLNLYSESRNQWIPASEVGTFTEREGFSEITYEGESKSFVVGATPSLSTSAFRLEKALLQQSFFDDGWERKSALPFSEDYFHLTKSIHGTAYHAELIGETRESFEANRILLKHVPTALLIMLVILILQTRSFWSVVAILASIPTGLVGAFLGLFLLGQPLGFMAITGILSLSGIILNIAILLDERIFRSSEESSVQLIGVALQDRWPAILLTTVTTLGGILPLYFFDSTLWKPFAAAFGGGLILAVPCTMLIVLCFASLQLRGANSA